MEFLRDMKSHGTSGESETAEREALRVHSEKNGRSKTTERRAEKHFGRGHTIAPIRLAQKRDGRFNGRRVQGERGRNECVEDGKFRSDERRCRIAGQSRLERVARGVGAAVLMIGSILVSVMRVRRCFRVVTGFLVARAGPAMRLTQGLRASPHKKRHHRKPAEQRTQLCLA